ncbi:MAG: bifunctional diguanylate cyclase/phosphodiesterase [Acidimicrobiia bacterium]|nr:bifunctional diguanylate cyclase/phosphodiesterase [Acidimicrobiia bacterium]
MSLIISVIGLTAPVEIGEPTVFLWSAISSIIILVAAARAQDKATKRLYFVLGGAGLLIVIGFVVRFVHGEIIGELQPMPSPADFLHVPGYLLFASATLLVHRARAVRRNADAWLDAGAGLLAGLITMWVLYLGDFVLDADRPLGHRLLNSTYNIIALTIVAVFLRITATPGRRPLSYLLLGFAGISFLFADIAATVSLVQGTGLSLAVGASPIVYGFTAAAVTHPSGAELLTRHREEELRVGPMRLTVIGAIMATPLLIQLTNYDQRSMSRLFLGVASASLVIMLIIRLSRLLRDQQRRLELDRRLALEVGQLGNLGSSEAVMDGLQISAQAVLRKPSFEISLSEPNHPQGWTSITSNAPETSGSAEAIWTNVPLDQAEERAISMLVREATLLGVTIDSRAESARQESEAEANRRIAINERRFRALVQNASDIVTVIGKDGTVSYISEAVTNVLGYRVEAFVDRSLEWVVHENDWEWAKEHFEAVASGTSTSRHRELRAVHADGGVRLFECLLTDMRHVEGIEGIVINATDATAKRSLERDLRDAETTDLLTLQLNRTAFLAETETAIRRSSVSSSSVAIAIINVDQFRTVNEGLGPSLADQVLVEIAQAIRRSVRMHDVVARLNGDEFGVLMPDGYSSIEAVHAVERIIGEIAEPINIGGHTLTLRSTAGVVLDTDGSHTGVSLLRNADTALDVAKNHHRGRTVLFEESMGEAASERIELRNTLETAIHNNELRLAYQPLVNIKTGEIASMEALARWEHPTRGNISPGAFIPIAESAGLITELGEWALRTACNQVVDWEADGLSGFTVSVNMSGHQLREENIIGRVRHILEETGVAANRITIEITESVLIDDTDFIAQRIAALRGLGLRLAIDDFGTGYSSLSYLTRYEFDVLKIDRSFVIPLADPKRTREREIVKAMINLARSLGAVSVAEGIEVNEEFETLEQLGCDYAQGYLFWYPLELDEVAQAFAESKQLAA